MPVEPDTRPAVRAAPGLGTGMDLSAVQAGVLP
jgi:hypothetical protein